jgi:hypothetical protein
MSPALVAPTNEQSAEGAIGSIFKDLVGICPLDHVAVVKTTSYPEIESNKSQAAQRVHPLRMSNCQHHICWRTNELPILVVESEWNLKTCGRLNSTFQNVCSLDK